MRVQLTGMGLLELIDNAEPDWRYSPVCPNPAEVARLVMANDNSPDGARVRALLANTLATTPSLMMAASSGLLKALEAALGNGSIRLTSGRTAQLQRLAPYTPPPKPVKAEQAPPRVGKQGPTEAPPPEEATVEEAQGECMKEAAEDGAPLVEQAE